MGNAPVVQQLGGVEEEKVYLSQAYEYAGSKARTVYDTAGNAVSQHISAAHHLSCSTATNLPDHRSAPSRKRQADTYPLAKKLRTQASQKPTPKTPNLSTSKSSKKPKALPKKPTLKPAIPPRPYHLVPPPQRTQQRTPHPPSQALSLA